MADSLRSHFREVDLDGHAVAAPKVCPDELVADIDDPRLIACHFLVEGTP